MVTCLVGGFKYFHIFYPQFGEVVHFDSYVSNGLKPPTRLDLGHGRDFTLTF